MWAFDRDKWDRPQHLHGFSLVLQNYIERTGRSHYQATTDSFSRSGLGRKHGHSATGM